MTPISSHALRLCSALAAVALLSACSSTPKITSQQESGEYLSRAGRNYTPPGPANDPWGPYIVEASAKFDVPQRWIREVMRQESGGNLYNRRGELITSGAGAMGLMQVMPATYDELRGRYRELGGDPFDPHNNIMAGTAYIREMFDIYGSPGFLAAYNAGPGRMDDYLTRNRTLPEETRRYVANIGPRIDGYAPSRPSPGAQYAMNSVPLSIPSGPRYPGIALGGGAQYAGQFGTTPVDDNAPRERIVLNRPAALQPAPIQLARLPEPPVPVFKPIVLAPPAAGPIEVAEAPEPAAERIRLAPAPQLAALPEPVPFQRIAMPEPPRAAQVAQAAPPASVRLAPRPRLTTFAQLPEPPRLVAPPPVQYAALQPVSPARRGGFQLVSSANAAPHHPANAPGNWSVQVGAFANPGLATSATAAARDQARDVLGGARPVVATVRQPGGTLYRARLTGLSRDAAAHACERLSRSRTNCMVVSPDSQS